MDFIEVVIDGPIPVDRDDVEDSLSAALDGVGEVSGAGTGSFVSNLDLDIDPEADRDDVLRRVFAALRELDLGGSVRVRPGDGSEWFRLGEW
ncbi:hypothetical protein [Yinghuangia soli]|uniref:Uncharacterized protein n=1 Tax=Yinghuangia soli TaxID=2908204 RepID=A0AA41PXU3_9ACTN|nr:hypothetical protein [Yinghuangia soli]MCF2527839.1 hypothetical protein [Yinghuangia soli]